MSNIKLPKLIYANCVHRICAIMKRLVKPYVFMIGSISFVMFSAGGVAVLLESDHGWVKTISKSMLYPIYAATCVSIWAWIGEKHTAGVMINLNLHIFHSI